MIRSLPPELRGRLAQGELLLSVRDAVRELVENALDAGARRIRIELWGGGLQRLVVEDDGEGIPLEELPLAVEPFTTSKLRDSDRITTLGFRGQALYALRQAASLRLRSRPRDQLGGGLLAVQGEELSLQKVVAPPGTRVEVVGLFAGEERDPAQEERGVLALLRRYLLHHPQCAFALFAEGTARLIFPGAPLAEAAQLAFGRVLSARLLPVRGIEGEMELVGLLSGPQASRTRSDLLFLAVNGRPVVLPEGLLKAIRRAYRELLPEGHFPYGVLNLSLPPEAYRLRLDAQKGEILLAPQVETLVETALREAFQRRGLARSFPEPSSLAPLPPTPSGLPRLRWIGQFRESYLLAEGGKMLFIVDQRAAHERVLFEELQRRLADEGLAPLAQPVLVELAPGEELGPVKIPLFTYEPFGPGRLRLLEAPPFPHPYPLLLPEIFRESLRETGKSLQSLLARLACLPALKAGHPLHQAEGQALLDALWPVECPGSARTEGQSF
jgi:DNA mismatch repair protein MutL